MARLLIRETGANNFATMSLLKIFSQPHELASEKIRWQLSSVGDSNWKISKAAQSADKYRIKQGLKKKIQP